MISTEQAKHEIASAAKDAVAAIAAAAAQAARVADISRGNDHDFMLTFTSEFRTKIDMLINEVKDLKEGTTSRINNLETCKAEKEDVKDIRDNQSKFIFAFVGLGGTAVISLIIAIFDLISKK
jgi:hypothetical protein